MTSATEKITGGCLCGRIRYQSEQPPYRVGHCHCRMCQKGVGNLFGTAAFFKHASFRYLQGEPTWYKADGGMRGFCSHCGSPVAFQRPEFTDDYCAIWLGSLDRPADYPPTVEWHLESKIHWAQTTPGLLDATPAEGAHRYDDEAV